MTISTIFLQLGHKKLNFQTLGSPRLMHKLHPTSPEAMPNPSTSPGAPWPLPHLSVRVERAVVSVVRTPGSKPSSLIGRAGVSCTHSPCQHLLYEALLHRFHSPLTLPIPPPPHTLLSWYYLYDAKVQYLNHISEPGPLGSKLPPSQSPDRLPPNCPQ